MRSAFAICRAGGVAMALLSGSLAAQTRPPGTGVAFAALPAFEADRATSAFETFRASCRAILHGTVPTVSAVSAPRALEPICGAASRAGRLSLGGSRAFFRRHFTLRRVMEPAFFTGYYEPVVAGSRVQTAAFPTPLYQPPTGLVAVTPGTIAGLDPTLNAARRLADGRFEALPDRRRIDGGALRGIAAPLLYVASPVDAFFIQIQGSARVRLPDGRLERVVYAGRNGYPYTSIGKLLVARLHMPPAAMGMSQLRAWLHRQGLGANDPGTRLMQEDRAFIFFRFDSSRPDQAGPVGAAGVPLTPGRSLAIDRTKWPYGLPFFIDTNLADGQPYRRLMVAQDTGAAILGAARADIFFGTGDAAAKRAGAMRQTGTLYVLWPRAARSPAGNP